MFGRSSLLFGRTSMLRRVSCRLGRTQAERTSPALYMRHSSQGPVSPARRRAAPLEKAKAAAVSVKASLKESLVKDWLNHAAGFFRALALVQADVLFLQGLMLVS